MSRLVPNQILHGDSRVVLKTLPAASVDSVVTDPPAGIAFMAKEWDTPNVANHKGHVAEHRRARTAFVADMTEVFVECHRVLKPGGHMFVWAIPRTSHWTAWALEEAGFEIRDCVYHVFGQGFPKSLNVSKAIDKTRGATREVVGTRKGKGGQNGNLLMRPEGGDSPDAKGCGAYGVGVVQTDIDIPVTAPATPEAQKWDGWGTALKPSTECWWLCRKPIEAHSVAANVLKHGTGAINIDGSRVAGTAQVPGSIRASRRFDDRGDRPELVEPPPPNAAGRWPANLMLSHSEGCRQIGETEVAAPVINRFTDGMKPFGEGAGHPYETYGGGTETIPVYECADGCPVKALDEQSGVTGGGTPTLNSDVDRTAISTTAHNPREPNQSDSLANYGDAGGASRYFQTFDPKGRWPANMVLSHGPGCVRRGTKQVKGNRTDTRPEGDAGRDDKTEWRTRPTEATRRGYSGDDGMETVEDWECAEGCPVREIDRQGQEMGVHPAGSPQPAQEKYEMSEMTPSFGGGFSGPSGMRYGDDGGASRFFQTLEPEVPFFYTAKASRGEKEDGLADPFVDAKRNNTHPTVKPLSLMRYLVKMVTPPGGVVLDPFAGSGSTLIAAVQEGMQFVGIEREAEYVKIAEARVGVVAAREAAVRSERDTFEMMMNLGDEDE